MYLFHIVILALVQGITEFLPISSSGHLFMLHQLIGVTEHDMTMDIAVHVGTLIAVLVFFKNDIWRIISSLKKGGDKTLLGHVAIASAPVICIGFLLHMSGADWTRNIALTGWCTIIFAILLAVADKFFPKDKTLDMLTNKHAVFIGIAQCFALIPGTSRSGVTMSAARFLGYSRTESARFSLLLATIAISGAGALGSIDMLSSPYSPLVFQFIIAAALSCIAAFIAIFLMMRWLQKASFMPFVYYRIVLGISILALYYGGHI